MTPRGEIFITGGSLDVDRKSRDCHQFDFVNKSLIKRAPMRQGRSSHSICLL